MNHYLHADWTKINIFAADPAVRGEAGKVWAAAFGQIFFTLSLGFGIMVTYASYLPAKGDIGKNALVTALVNCLYSFIAGFAVFGVIFFMMLIIAGLTPGGSLVEAFVCAITDKFDWPRRKVVFCLVLAFYPWRAGKLKRRHRPEEDKLLV